MEAPNWGKVHSLNDHRPALKVGGGAGWRRVTDHRMRATLLTFTIRRWSGPCWLSTRSRTPNSELYLTRLTVPLCYKSTMLHWKTMPFALRISDKDRHGNGLQCQLSAVLAHDVNDQNETLLTVRDVIFFLCQHRVRPSRNPKTPPNFCPSYFSIPTHDPCPDARNVPQIVSQFHPAFLLGLVSAYARQLSVHLSFQQLVL